MLTFPTTVTTYLTPGDAVPARQALLALLTSAKVRIRLLMYGFTDPQLIDALAAAHTRGVDVQCILDHTQAVGATEALALHRLLLTLPAANVRIGTSPSHDQLIHLKCLVVDGTQTAKGSLNWSPSAFEQINNLDICTSSDCAAAYESLFNQEWAWIDANEAAYNTPAAMS